MGYSVDLSAKIKTYYKFPKPELYGFIAVIAILSFIISFSEWGKDEFNFAIGIFNWFNSALIVTFVLLIHNFVQRVAGWNKGYNVEYKAWLTGLFIGVIAVFLTRGRIWVLLPGGIMIHHLTGHRLGHFRYGLNYFQHGMISVAGPISLISLAIVFKALNEALSNSLISKMVTFCVVLAIYEILPIPPLDGSKLFFGSRMAYVFFLSTIIIAGILILSDANPLMTIIGSLIVGLILWLLYYIFFERKVWGGPWAK